MKTLIAVALFLFPCGALHAAPEMPVDSGSQALAEALQAEVDAYIAQFSGDQYSETYAIAKALSDAVNELIATGGLYARLAALQFDR